MRKKYLSALLFGALLFASAGTFTSCKDYDDDIENLQGQINSNKDAISALQKLVGEGKWVTAISPIENGFTVTMSDGTSQTVKGINGKDGANGKDGKDGTQWTISEDGFWVCDGEKTAFVAVGKDGANGENGQDGQNGQDGKNGLTAPSPQISANGNWIVYNFNEATGEFEATETEFSAIGTAAYVVLKDNAYELNIADQTGKYQQIVLPATSDSFIATAPARTITVKFEAAKWNPTTTNRVYQQFVAQFPELAEIEKNTLLKQGGHLPVLINPGNIELTDQYSYSLQTIKGETPAIAISNPVKGLVNASVDTNGDMTTRAAEGSECFWTLNIDPAEDKTGTAGFTNVTTPASLVIKNAKGTAVKTAFAYKVEATNLTNTSVTITRPNIGRGIGIAPYAPAIDLLAGYDPALLTRAAGDEYYPVQINNGYEGKYIIKLAKQLEVEKYDLSIAEDGHTLLIGNMPKNETAITVTLNILALGLNGSVDEIPNYQLTIKQQMVAEGQLTDKMVTLAYNEEATPGNKTKQNVLWDVADLKFSATQLDKLIRAGHKSVKVTYIDENGDEQRVPYVYNMLCKKEDGKADATTYDKFAKMGFELNAAYFSPKYDYKVTLTFAESYDGPVIYSAEANLAVKNPDASSIFSLAKAYTENGILQVVGTPNQAVNINTNGVIVNINGVIVYNLENGIVAPSYAENPTFIDLDHKSWTESLGSDTDFGATNWVDNTGKKLFVYPNGTEITVGETPNQVTKMIDQERKIQATYELFGNSDNKVTYDFVVKVKSPIYNADATKAIKQDATKLTAEFGGDAIDIRKALKGIYAAGLNKGNEYSLFTITEAKTETYTIYSDEVAELKMKINDVECKANVYLDKNGVPVTLSVNDMAKFGYTATDIAKAQSGTKYYLTKNSWTPTGGGAALTIKSMTDLWAYAEDYYVSYTKDGKTGWRRNVTDANVAAADKEGLKLYETYNEKLAIGTIKKTLSGVNNIATIADELHNVTLGWVNSSEASKYVDIDNSDIATGSIKPLSNVNAADLVDEKAIVNVKMTVEDKWGMKMIVNVPVTLTRPE